MSPTSWLVKLVLTILVSLLRIQVVLRILNIHAYSPEIMQAKKKIYLTAVFNCKELKLFNGLMGSIYMRIVTGRVL